MGSEAARFLGKKLSHRQLCVSTLHACQLSTASSRQSRNESQSPNSSPVVLQPLRKVDSRPLTMHTKPQRHGVTGQQQERWCVAQEPRQFCPLQTGQDRGSLLPTNHQAPEPQQLQGGLWLRFQHRARSTFLVQVTGQERLTFRFRIPPSPSPVLGALLGIFGWSGPPRALALLSLGLFPGDWGWRPAETYCLSPDGAG